MAAPSKPPALPKQTLYHNSSAQRARQPPGAAPPPPSLFPDPRPLDRGMRWDDRRRRRRRGDDVPPGAALLHIQMPIQRASPQGQCWWSCVCVLLMHQPQRPPPHACSSSPSPPSRPSHQGRRMAWGAVAACKCAAATKEAAGLRSLEGGTCGLCVRGSWIVGRSQRTPTVPSFSSTFRACRQPASRLLCAEFLLVAATRPRQTPLPSFDPHPIPILLVAGTRCVLSKPRRQQPRQPANKQGGGGGIVGVVGFANKKGKDWRRAPLAPRAFFNVFFFNLIEKQSRGGLGDDQGIRKAPIDRGSRCCVDALAVCVVVGQRWSSPRSRSAKPMT
jgi:hypothetical protein